MGQTTTTPRGDMTLADELAAVARRLRITDCEKRLALALARKADKEEQR